MIETERLILRLWRDDDRAPFAALCGDGEVMRHLGGPQTMAEAAAAIDRWRRSEADHGHSFWAVERREDASLLGFCGLRIGGHPGTGVCDELEIGWRLRRDAWGQGYAAEAARACLHWAWRHTDRPRVVAWTVPANIPSWRLMERIGMVARPDLDFGHPAFPRDHPLHHHRVYAIDLPADG